MCFSDHLSIEMSYVVQLYVVTCTFLTLLSFTSFFPFFFSGCKCRCNIKGTFLNPCKHSPHKKISANMLPLACKKMAKKFRNLFRPISMQNRILRTFYFMDEIRNPNGYGAIHVLSEKCEHFVKLLIFG